MTPGIVRVLVKCGALPPKNTGPANPKSEEEAKQIKAEQTSTAARLRRKLIREAKQRIRAKLAKHHAKRDLKRKQRMLSDAPQPLIIN